MGLVLAREPGQDVYVDDTRVIVTRILGPYKYEVEVRGQNLNSRYIITDRESTEILKNVMLSAGLDGSPELAKLHFECSRSIIIKRGEIHETYYNG